MSILSRKIGIDLGTSTVLIYVKGEGIVVNEPSLVALNRDGTRILAVGKQAFEMVGRAPDSIQIVRPMRDGVIADFVVTEGMLHHLIGKVQGRQRLFRPEIMICVPSGVTSVERRAVTEAAISAGARQAWLIDEPLAAAIGGLDGIVFTAGVGENAAAVRSAICRACGWLGLELDEAANRQHQTRISTSSSRVAAYVIKTDENLMIARHARPLVGS